MKKTCLRLTDWEREYVRRYGKLNEFHYNDLRAQGLSSTDAMAVIDKNIAICVSAVLEREQKEKEEILNQELKYEWQTVKESETPFYKKEC